jgi:hypothetical protein
MDTHLFAGLTPTPPSDEYTTALCHRPWNKLCLGIQ